jgi:hypothetical protein
MSMNKTYTRELKDNLNYTATWLPNVKLSLGDVGLLSNYEFIYRTNLKNLGVPFKEGSPGGSATYSFISSEAVTRNLKVAGNAQLPGSVLTEADAGITFSFGKKHAIVFLATDCTIRSISDQEPLKKLILNAYSAGQWDREYVVVTELVAAGSTSVIISEGSEGRYELKAKAGLTPTFEAMNVEGNFSLAHDSQIGFNCLAKSGMTPLFRCLGLRIGWFRDDIVTRADVVPGDPRGAGTDPTNQRVMVDEVEYDDYRAAEKP